jgi:hypothetical protein
MIEQVAKHIGLSAIRMIGEPWSKFEDNGRRLGCSPSSYSVGSRYAEERFMFEGHEISLTIIR